LLKPKPGNYINLEIVKLRNEDFVPATNLTSKVIGIGEISTVVARKCSNSSCSAWYCTVLCDS